MTIQQFIKAVRKMRNPLLLEHVHPFYEASKTGVAHYGKNSPAMRELQALGYFKLDKKSCELPNYKPTWHITEAGRALLPPSAVTSPHQGAQNG
jgi:hypothetical protein